MLGPDIIAACFNLMHPDPEESSPENKENCFQSCACHSAVTVSKVPIGRWRKEKIEQLGQPYVESRICSSILFPTKKAVSVWQSSKEHLENLCLIWWQPKKQFCDLRSVLNDFSK